LPFPEDLEEEKATRLSELLGHYAFRLFLRGAIQKGQGFAPKEATQYLKHAQSRECAESLVRLGLAERTSRGRYRMLWAARSFGGTLEWYVARELSRRLGFDVAAGVRFHARGVGGDLDVVAAAEGKLAYLELKSSPPKNLSVREVGAFFDRVYMLRPDVTLFVVDTALRLSDKVLPMLVTELEHRRGRTQVTPRRIERELWAVTPHLYAVNGKLDLMANIACPGGRSIRPFPANLTTRREEEEGVAKEPTVFQSEGKALTCTLAFCDQTWAPSGFQRWG
jgi:hypothetical protein